MRKKCEANGLYELIDSANIHTVPNTPCCFISFFFVLFSYHSVSFLLTIILQFPYQVCLLHAISADLASFSVDRGRLMRMLIVSRALALPRIHLAVVSNCRFLEGRAEHLALSIAAFTRHS